MDTVVYTLFPPQGKAATALWIMPVVLAVVLLVVGVLVTKSIAGARSSTFSLLLSVSDPERFVEHLRRVAPAG